MAYLNSEGLAKQVQYIKAYVNDRIDTSLNGLGNTYAPKTYVDTKISEVDTQIDNISIQVNGKIESNSVNYIKSANVSGSTLTLTKGNNTTVTFTAPEPTDTKVTNTLGTTTKFYVTGTTSATTNTGTQYFDTGVYVTATAGNLYATTFNTGGNITMGGTSGTSYIQLPSGIKLY